MRRGDFPAAHAISDEVLAERDPAAADDPRLPYHLRWVWDGRGLAGRHVLVRCYHGLGDTLQFARYLPHLAQVAASVMVEVQASLLSLLCGTPGVRRWVPFRPDAPLPPAECDIEVMELGHALRLEAMGESVPYLKAEPGFDLVGANSSVSLPGMTARRWIGLCWRAGAWDAERSVPQDLLQRACDVPGLRLHSLAAHPPGADVLATARVVSALDLVVTVDTMMAHLAGALGRPTWLLLKRDADWRWMERRTDSPWYPTMRLYRQTRAGDWRAPLAALRSDLKRVAAAD